MTMPATGLDTDYVAELYPNVAAVASVYGDPAGKYTNFLANAEGVGYVQDANFLWNQPLSDHGYSQSAAANGSPSASTTSGAPNGKSTVGTRPENMAFRIELASWRAWGMLYGTCILVMVVSLVDFL